MPKREIYLDDMIGDDYRPLKCDGENLPIEISKEKMRCNYPIELSSLKVAGQDIDKWERYIVHCGWYGTASKMYIPLNGYIYEKTVTSSNNEYIAFVAPYDGYLDFVVARSEAVCGSTTIGLHKSSSGTEVPNTTASNEVTEDMSVDDTPYKFSFGSDASFDAGDIIALSFDPTSSSLDTNTTCVFMFDTKAELI